MCPSADLHGLARGHNSPDANVPCIQYTRGGKKNKKEGIFMMLKKSGKEKSQNEEIKKTNKRKTFEEKWSERKNVTVEIKQQPSLTELRNLRRPCEPKKI